MKPRILVIDDNENFQELMRVVLQKDYEFDILPSAEGWDQKLQTFKPDLIILDIMMPGLNGVELCRSIRLIPGLSTLPILVVTAAGHFDMLDAKRVGATRVISKPFDPFDLLKMLSEMLGKKE